MPQLQSPLLLFWLLQLCLLTSALANDPLTWKPPPNVEDPLYLDSFRLLPLPLCPIPPVSPYPRITWTPGNCQITVVYYTFLPIRIKFETRTCSSAVLQHPRGISLVYSQGQGGVEGYVGRQPRRWLEVHTVQGTVTIDWDSKVPEWWIFLKIQAYSRKVLSWGPRKKILGEHAPWSL